MQKHVAQSSLVTIRERLRRVWHEQWGSQGLEAAGAALAAAIIIGALLLMAPTVAQRVERALDCAASVLTGGGSCASGSTPTGGDTPTTTQEAPPEADDCGFWCQVGGFFKGMWEGARDFVVGIKDLAVDIYGLITGDPETLAKYEQLIQAIKDDPLGTGKAILEGIIAPIVEDWQAGRYGEAIGRGFFDIASTIIGDKGIGKLGKLSKLDDVARVGNRGDDVVRRIPCVGSTAPRGRGPGLAAPLACPDGDPFPNQMPDELARELELGRRLGVEPMRVGDPGFNDMVNQGTVKWVVTESGELLVMPKHVNGVEIPHTVLTGGKPVRAAGEADIAAANGERVLIDINNHSGHYRPDAGTEDIGREAFEEQGVR